MDVMFERVAGLDVHKAMVVATVRVVSDGKVKRECRTFETTTAGLLELLGWLTESRCTHVAMEATGVYWKPVWSILSDGEFELDGLPPGKVPLRVEQMGRELPVLSPKEALSVPTDRPVTLIVAAPSAGRIEGRVPV